MFFVETSIFPSVVQVSDALIKDHSTVITYLKETKRESYDDFSQREAYKVWNTFRNDKQNSRATFNTLGELSGKSKKSLYLSIEEIEKFSQFFCPI